MNLIIASSLLHHDVAVIDALDDHLGIGGNFDIEIPYHAIAVVIVAAIIGSVPGAPRAVFVEPHEIALLRHIHLHVALGFGDGFLVIRENVLVDADANLRAAVTGDVNVPADVIHQQFPAA